MLFFTFFYINYYLWQWHPTPVILPGKSHGWRRLVGCSPWSRWSQTRLNDFIFTFHFHALEKEMATHSNVLAWRIPGTGKPSGLPSMGLQSQTRLKQLSSSSSSRPFLNLLYWLIFLLTMDHIFLFLYISYNFSVNFEHYNRFNFVFLQIVKHFVLSEVNLWIHLIFSWLLLQV